jgi:glutathione-regulated potassium-efflux system ancillary protein KefG
MRILILFGHPAFQTSHINRRMIEGLEQMEHVTFHDLYAAYPELDIDVEREQELLQDHDCIIFQHPMYWYSSPAIFKEWQDLVLEHGWAYGSKGKALEGKLFFNAMTTGAPKISFQKGGFQDHTVREFLSPFMQMARLCKMIPLPPFVIHGSHLVSEVRMQKAQREYHALLRHLGSAEFKVEKAMEMEYLNELVLEEENYARR